MTGCGPTTHPDTPLAEADRRALPPIGVYGWGLLHPEVESFFSARQLCGLMRGVHDLPALHRNPGVADARQ